MQHSESITKLAVALVEAQAELTNVVESASNPFFKSMYAPLNTVIDHAKPVLTKHGLAIVQGNTPTENGVIVDTMLIHTSGEWIKSELNMPLAKNDPQGAGSAITYGRRYAYSAIIGISSGDDDDANSASNKGGVAKATKQEPINGNGTNGLQNKCQCGQPMVERTVTVKRGTPEEKQVQMLACPKATRENQAEHSKPVWL
jgi:hypothetical protein